MLVEIAVPCEFLNLVVELIIMQELLKPDNIGMLDILENFKLTFVLILRILILLKDLLIHHFQSKFIASFYKKGFSNDTTSTLSYNCTYCVSFVDIVYLFKLSINFHSIIVFFHIWVLQYICSILKIWKHIWLLRCRLYSQWWVTNYQLITFIIFIWIINWIETQITQYLIL